MFYVHEVRNLLRASNFRTPARPALFENFWLWSVGGSGSLLRHVRFNPEADTNRKGRHVGLDPRLFGTHSLRRTKATLIYRRTGNLRAVQLLLDHTKIESTVRYLGIEVDNVLTIAQQVDV
jgi:integrase